ncbi:MAG: transketolase C-terminal domain-containing protein [bacterium]
MRDTFIASLSELAARDPRIFLITGDLGFSVLDAFARDRPGQFLNAGVAEQNMTGLATGLALDGRIVFTYSIANFPTLRPLEQIRNDAAYHDANVNVVAVGGGFSYGQLGISHHATEDLAIFRALPGLTVVSPGDDWETHCAVAALAECPGTTYLRLDKSSAGRTERPGESFVLGKARTLREGSALTLVATGGILGVALEAADQLSTEGIACRVLSMHTIKPLDVDALIAAARETGGIISVEEHTVHGGLGGAIAESLLEAGVVPRAFYRIGLRAGFSSIVGSQDYLRTVYELDAPAICAAARRMVGAP